MTTTLLPGLLKAAARNVGPRRGRRRAVRDGDRDCAARRRPARRSRRVDRRPTEGELADLDKALPAQPLHLGVVLAGERERSGWWGEGRAAGWAGRGRGRPRRSPTRSVCRSQVRAAVRAPWHPGRCAELVAGEVVLGHAGELHPRVCTAYGVPAAHRGRRDRPGPADGRWPSTWSPGRCSPTYPVAKEDVALVVADDGAGRDGGGGAARGRRRAAGVDPALRRLHRRPGGRRARSRWPSRCASGLPTGR